MDILVIIMAILAGIIGIVGSIIPGIPGPPISWVGLLILYIWGNGTNWAGDPMSIASLLVWGAIVVAVTIADYFIPMYFTKKTGGSKCAERGAMIGLIVGIIFTPIGMIPGSFLGAFLAELIFARKGLLPSLKAAAGSFLGFIAGTGIKIMVSVLIMWKIVVYMV